MHARLATGSMHHYHVQVAFERAHTAGNTYEEYKPMSWHVTSLLTQFTQQKCQQLFYRIWHLYWLYLVSPWAAGPLTPAPLQPQKACPGLPSARTRITRRYTAHYRRIVYLHPRCLRRCSEMEFDSSSSPFAARGTHPRISPWCILHLHTYRFRPLLGISPEPLCCAHLQQSRA